MNIFKVKELQFGFARAPACVVRPGPRPRSGPTIPARNADDNVVSMKTFEQLIERIIKHDAEMIEAITRWHERRRKYDLQVEQNRAAMDEQLQRLEYLMNKNKDQALQLLHGMFPNANPDEIDRVLWPAKDHSRLDVQVRKPEPTE